jgi:NAD(P)-dependent dehydrogenase (short-subunit alcohol dehydrogenase family)
MTSLVEHWKKNNVGENNHDNTGPKCLPPIKFRVDFLKLDLCDLEQVREAAEELKSRYDRIDICINNAGVGFGKRFATKQGHEGCMGNRK